MIKNSAKH